MINLFYWSKFVKSRFDVAHVVNKTRLSALRASGTSEAGFFWWFNFFCRDGSNEVSHAPGWIREVCFIQQADRQADRENEYMYI